MMRGGVGSGQAGPAGASAARRKVGARARTDGRGRGGMPENPRAGWGGERNMREKHSNISFNRI